MTKSEARKMRRLEIQIEELQAANSRHLDVYREIIMENIALRTRITYIEEIALELAAEIQGGGVMIREEVIGDCRLILGDCLEVLPTLEKVDAVVTDPPYGRKFIGIELEEKYFDIACRRIEEAVKKEASRLPGLKVKEKPQQVSVF